jgi:hypothetical protein
VGDDWGRPTYLHQEPEDRQGVPYAVLVLLVLALFVLCAAGFVVVRLLLPNQSPGIIPSFVTWTPSPVSGAPDSSPATTATAVGATEQPQVTINPQNGYVNTLLTVTGEGWWPGEPVFIFLRSPAEGDGQGYSYAAAVADDWGSFRTALTFPNEMRWIGQERADVIARGTRSGQEAVTQFTLTPPTPTPTSPPPTARPTLAVTDTPVPTPTPVSEATPTDTPAPTPTPDIIITDWRGEYYADIAFGGNPALIRNDTIIDFNWGGNSPTADIPADRFSARWTRTLSFQEGLYRFTAMADDGVRFWLDGQLLIDEWHDGTLETYSVDVQVTGGEHALHLEYYENSGGARIYFAWAQAKPPALITPSPTATTEPSTLGPWLGEYFANPSLNGVPVLTRLDPELNFDWGAGSPDPSVPADDFSARWTREVSLTGGIYRFSLEADDGVRFWIDGQLLIDAWPATPGQIYSTEVFVPDGVHIQWVEFFEVTGDARARFWSEIVP